MTTAKATKIVLRRWVYSWSTACSMFVIIGVMILGLLPSSAQTATRTFYDSQGRFAGTSTTRGNSSSFYNEQGGFAGSSIRNGNSRSFYDSQGRFVGSSTSNGRR